MYAYQSKWGFRGSEHRKQPWRHIHQSTLLTVDNQDLKKINKTKGSYGWSGVWIQLISIQTHLIQSIIAQSSFSDQTNLLNSPCETFMLFFTQFFSLLVSWKASSINSSQNSMPRIMRAKLEEDKKKTKIVLLVFPWTVLLTRSLCFFAP